MQIAETYSNVFYSSLVQFVINLYILTVLLYRCETWSLTIKEKHGLGAFENGILRQMFGSKREKLMGG